MAKIGELQVTAIKIKNGSLVYFFLPSGSTLSIAREGSILPTMIFIRQAAGGGGVTVTRNRDGKVIFQGQGLLATMAIDNDPQEIETYSISGAATVSAMVKGR